MAAQIQPTLIILRRKEVEGRTGLSRSTIYALISEKKFPSPIDLGGGRAVGWLDHEISAWIEQRIKETRGSQA
ncbi:MAG: AlpA family transcriptional regulator [Sulfuricella sp.]